MESSVLEVLRCLLEDQVSETPQSRILVSSCSQVLPGVSQINQAPVWMNAACYFVLVSVLESATQHERPASHTWAMLK